MRYYLLPCQLGLLYIQNVDLLNAVSQWTLLDHSWILFYKHSVKSVRIRSYSCPYFPAFKLNTERYFLSLRIQSECGKIRTRMTPNTDTFYAGKVSLQDGES